MKIEFIAEIGSNHNQDRGRTKKIIETTADIGCDGVKFQYFKAEKLSAIPEQIEKLRKQEIDLQELKKNILLAQSLNLIVGCSVFDTQGVKELADTEINYLKVASYEILKLDLFEELIKTNKKIHFSTGMASEEEIYTVIKILENRKSKIGDDTIYHCCPEYPAPINHIDLEKIFQFKIDHQYHYGKCFRIGYSDHSKNPDIILAAIGAGATVIEFHIDLEDKEGQENIGHCWSPEEAKEMIKRCRAIEPALNSYHYPEKLRTQRADIRDGKRPFMTERGY